MLRNLHPRLTLRRPRLLIPPEHRKNFRNLYFEIAWFGILNGTVLSFLSVFATRAGASNSQIGLIGAVPAVANLLFSLPASTLLQKLPTARVVFWSSFLQRIFYLGLVLLPFFIDNQPLIWLIIVMTFLLSIPGTGLAVGMNALIARAVPIDWRAHVVGTRNAILSFITILSLFISGQLLTVLPFPLNYQVVFGLGFLGGMLSCLHLFLVRPIDEENNKVKSLTFTSLKIKSEYANVRPEIRRRIKLANLPQKLNLKALKSKYGVILLILFMFWLALYLSIPILPVFQVKVLEFSDKTISLGSSFFQITTLLASTQIGVLARRHSNHKLTGIGISILFIYPVLLPFCKTLLPFLMVSAAGGISWAMINGCLVNYLLEHIAPENLAGHLALYNLSMNSAILLGSLAGPWIAGEIGLAPALIVFGIGRLLAGLALLRWG